MGAVAFAGAGAFSGAGAGAFAGVGAFTFVVAAEVVARAVNPATVARHITCAGKTGKCAVNPARVAARGEGCRVHGDYCRDSSAGNLRVHACWVDGMVGWPGSGPEENTELAMGAALGPPTGASA